MNKMTTTIELVELGRRFKLVRQKLGLPRIV